MASYNKCKISRIDLSSFSGFEGFGKITFSHEGDDSKVSQYNESFNYFSSYASLYFINVCPIITLTTISNSTGKTSGIEFYRTGDGKSILKNINFIGIIIHNIADNLGESAGLVVMVGNSHANLENAYFANCDAIYITYRQNAPKIELKNIFCDESFESNVQNKFTGTLDIGLGIALCKAGDCSLPYCKEQKKFFMFGIFSLLLNLFYIYYIYTHKSSE